MLEPSPEEERAVEVALGIDVPTREEIENRLFEQEMGLLSERYLRNLRREATIISR